MVKLKRQPRVRWMQAAGWLLALGLLVWVMKTVPVTAVFRSLAQLQSWQIAGLVLLNGLIVALLTARWWRVLHGLGVRLPFGLLLRHRLAAFGVTYFTPGPQFGGEPVQVLLVEKGHGAPRTTAVSAVALDKALELLVNFSFLALGVMLWLETNLLQTDLGWQTAVLPLIMVGFPLLYLAALWQGRQPLAGMMRQTKPLFKPRPLWLKQWTKAAAGMAASEAEAGRFCRRSTRQLLAALAVSLAGWLFMVCEYGLMLTFLGAEVTPAQTILALTAVRLAYLLPSPGGLGTLEAAQVAAMTQLGLDPAVGLSASLLIRGRDILLGLSGLWWGNHFLTRLHHQSSQKEVSDDQFP